MHLFLSNPTVWIPGIQMLVSFSILVIAILAYRRGRK